MTNYNTKDNKFYFNIKHFSKECMGRVGELHTRRGVIQTPVFMPVGTAGTVKSLTPDEVEGAGASIILGNTYHLYLRPGTDVLDYYGGLHKMMSWNKPILTDSGGFQVFSLKKLNKITDEGVEFSSHIDGSKHFISPSESMRIQRSIGSEIMMVFDECTSYPSTIEVAKEAMLRSAKWAQMCRNDHPPMRNGQALFGIVQGSMYMPLRYESIQRTSEIGFDGLAIGGLSVGEPKEVMLEVLEATMRNVPQHLPRYLMGVGTPEDLLYGVKFGVDMFDCVHPTRIARHGTVFTPTGRLNLLNAVHKYSDAPIDEECDCYGCQRFSRGYLRHLFKAKELLGPRIASLHNIRFMLRLMEKIRESLLNDTFFAFYNTFLAKYLGNNE